MELAGGGCLQFFIALFIGIFGVGILGGGDASTPTTDAPRVQVTLVTDHEMAEAEDIETTAGVLMHRLDVLGLENTLVEVMPEYDIRVTFPALEEPTPDEVVAILTATGALELVDFTGLDTAALMNQPISTRFYPNHAPGALLHPLTKEPFEGVLSSLDVLSAEAAPSEFAPGDWVVNIILSPEAGERLRAFSREHIAEPMGIVVDGVVIAAPVINSEIGSEVVIQSDFDRAEAQRLAVSLSGGGLPVPLSVAAMETVETGG